MDSGCEAAKDRFLKGMDVHQPDDQRQGNNVFPGDIIRNGFDAYNYAAAEPPNPYLGVCMYYRDVFGSVRRTRLCLMSPYGQTPHSLLSCPWYNEAN